MIHIDCIKPPLKGQYQIGNNNILLNNEKSMLVNNLNKLIWNKLSITISVKTQSSAYILNICTGLLLR